MRYAEALHGIVAVLILVICLVTPRPGMTVLLVPLWENGQIGTVLNKIPNAQLLGRGRPNGSVLLLSEHWLPLGMMLQQGILPVGVPAVLCGQATRPT